MANKQLAKVTLIWKQNEPIHILDQVEYKLFSTYYVTDITGNKDKIF